MTAQIIQISPRAAPKPRKQVAAPVIGRLRSTGNASLDWLEVSATVNLFRDMAAACGWILPEDPRDAAMRLADRAMWACFKLDNAAKELGFAPSPATAAAEASPSYSRA